MNRREFLSAAATVAAGAGLAVAEEKAAPLPIVDTHQHLWDLKKFKLPWIKEGAPLDRSFVLADYKEATAGLNVVKSVYMEVDLAVDQEPLEVDYVTELCRRPDNPMAAAVVSGRPAADGFVKYLNRFRHNTYIKGLRQVLHGDAPAGYCLEPAFVKGIRVLGDRGLSFDLCMRPTELLDGAKLAETCPGTRFILDHCGNAPVQKDLTQWKKDIAEVAKRKNVVACKVSGIVAGAGEKWTPADLAPAILHTLEVFGPDRVMFGGDWPVCTITATYKRWVEALRSIVADRPLEERRKLFHDNALRVYALPE